jgi:hypothetical protein
MARRKRPPPACKYCEAPCPYDVASSRYPLTCGSAQCLHKAKGDSARKATHPEKVWPAAFAGLKYRRRAKLAVLHHYSNGTMRCACCGISYIEFLTIDHIDGSGAEHRRTLGDGKIGSGGARFYPWLIKNHFPLGYQVLCQNCNFSKGVWGYCPHEKRDDLLILPMEIFERNIGANRKGKKMGTVVGNSGCDTAGAGISEGGAQPGPEDKT